MYIKKCKYCDKEFKSTQPNAEYCSKYHSGKARSERQAAKKEKMKKLKCEWLRCAKNKKGYCDAKEKNIILKNIKIGDSCYLTCDNFD